MVKTSPLVAAAAAFAAITLVAAGLLYVSFLIALVLSRALGWLA